MVRREEAYGIGPTGGSQLSGGRRVCPDQHECPRRFEIEKSFRMAKSDLQARPIYHRTRDSIEAHLTIVFAALAVSRWIEDTTGWSIKKFVKTVRRYRTIQIQAGEHVITAADPLPGDVHQTLEAIKTRAATH